MQVHEEEDLLVNTASMLRLKLKAKLIKDTSSIFKDLSKNKAVLPKRYLRISERTLMCDYKVGLKIINQKTPVYIELPKLSEAGNGMYSEIRADGEKEINVPDNPMLEDTGNTGLIE